MPRRSQSREGGQDVRGVGGTCSLKPGGWEALRDTTALQTASTALSTPQCPVTKAFSQLLGSQHLAPHLFSISGVLSVASLAWETGEGDCCEHCPHPPPPQAVLMENPCHTSSEGPEGPSKGAVPCYRPGSGVQSSAPVRLPVTLYKCK